MLAALLMTLLFLTALILIGIILIQRGKGGGLAGAFGGLGGQSAFGTKAGDTFTRITIGVAAVWILLCMISIKTFARPQSRFKPAAPPPTTTSTTAPVKPGAAPVAELPAAGQANQGATGTSAATPSASGTPTGGTAAGGTPSHGGDGASAPSSPSGTSAPAKGGS